MRPCCAAMSRGTTGASSGSTPILPFLPPLARQSEVVSRPDHAGRRNWRGHLLRADPQLAPKTAAQDRSAICITIPISRNHHHQGLVGTLVVMPTDAQPHATGWTGLAADIRDLQVELVARETLWFIQGELHFTALSDRNLSPQRVVAHFGS